MGEWGEASARGKPGAEHLGQEMKRQTDLGQGELQVGWSSAVNLERETGKKFRL